MEDQNNKKRVRDDSDESSMDSLEVKRLREDLLGFLDESDLDPAILDLDSVMKSFEEEISVGPSSPVPVVDLISDSGDSQPELGYLLEASDDELGLPPSIDSTSRAEKNEEIELVRATSHSSGIGETWSFEDQLSSYNSFELGNLDDYENNDNDYVAFEGLFEYSDVYFEYSDSSRRHETLPAQ